VIVGASGGKKQHEAQRMNFRKSTNPVKNKTGAAAIGGHDETPKSN